MTLIVAGLLLLALGFAAGRLVAPSGTVGPPPIVRYGPATLHPGEDAMVAISGPLIEREVSDSVAAANLPFSFDQVVTHFDTTGIHLSGRASVTILGVTAHGPIETVLRPYPTADGRLGVALSDTSAAGISLPGGAQDLIESAVNTELNRTVRLPGYSIVDIELSDGALLVYLRVDPK